MTGRHSKRPGHESWTPVVVRPVWPMVVRTGAHRVCPARLAQHAWPSEKTGALPVFRRVPR